MKEQKNEDVQEFVATICKKIFWHLTSIVVGVFLGRCVVAPALYPIIFNDNQPEIEVALEADETLGEPFVKIAIEESIFSKNLIDANGGLITTPDSLNAKRDVWVEYVVVNDYVHTSRALINGDIVGAWYTVNTYAQLGGKFREAGVDCVMPYIYSYSGGADGIIARNDVNSIEDWIGKKIAVSFYPDSRILVEWVIQNSSLSPEEIIGIRDNMKYYDTSDDVARAFFAGEVDIASTWSPYIDMAEESKKSRVFFDTSMNKNLVLNGIVFRSDFIHENEEFVVNFIAAALEASTMYEQELSYIHSIPMFEFMNNEEILNMVDDAGLVTWDENLKLLSGEAAQLYLDAARVWEELDYSVTPENAESAFTNEYILKVQEKKEVKYEQ